MLFLFFLINFTFAQLTFQVPSCDECSSNGTFCLSSGASNLPGECFNDTEPVTCKCFYATNPAPCNSYSFTTCNLFTNFCKIKRTKKGKMNCIPLRAPTRPPTKRRRRRSPRRSPRRRPRQPPLFPFSIELKFEVTPSVELIALFERARETWMQIVTTPRFGKRLTLDKRECGCHGIPWTCFKRKLSFTGLLIYVRITTIDGVGDRAGQTAICRLANNFVRIALIQLDQNDLIALQNSRLVSDVILHEMGHAIGLGGMWSRLNLVDEDGNYKGQFGNEGNLELGFTGPALVEQKGAVGSIRSHWRESVYGSELMTPVLTYYERHPISIVTIQALRDLGHWVNESYELEQYTPTNNNEERSSSSNKEWKTNNIILLT